MVCCCVLYRMIVYVQVAELYWIVHLYGLSPVWTLMWECRGPDRLNALSQTWHLYGFSPLWILLCLTRCPASVNRFPQTVHSNGFSPEWLCLCVARSRLLWQCLLHSVHLYLYEYSYENKGWHHLKTFLTMSTWISVSSSVSDIMLCLLQVWSDPW